MKVWFLNCGAASVGRWKKLVSKKKVDVGQVTTDASIYLRPNFLLILEWAILILSSLKSRGEASISCFLIVDRKESWNSRGTFCCFERREVSRRTDSTRAGEREAADGSSETRERSSGATQARQWRWGELVDWIECVCCHSVKFKLFWRTHLQNQRF